MFKTKIALAEASVRLETALARIAELESNARAQAEVFQGRLADLANAKKANEELKDQLQAEKLKNAVLLERLDLVANYGLGGTPSEEPKNISEDLEDAEYALAHGVIDKKAYEQLLHEHGFDNTELDVFQPGDYPRLASQ